MAVTSTAPWQVGAGLPFVASITDPPGVDTLGARIETPINRAIVDYFKLATLQGGVWVVTMQAPADPGFYELVWRDADGRGPGGDPTTEIFVPVQVLAAADLDTLDIPIFPAVDREQIKPEVDEVAKLERSRLVDGGGGDQGTFTDDTHPTSAEVEEIVEQAVDDVLMQLPGTTFDPKHYPQVRRAITLHAAVLIEGSYYREQANDAAVALWQTLLSNAVTALQARIQNDLDVQETAGGASLGRILY